MRTIFIMIATALVLSSCEKEYTCTCTYPGQTVGTTKTTFKAAKKSDAQTSCNNLNEQAKTQGGACAL